MLSWNFLSVGKCSLYKTNTPINIKRQIVAGDMKHGNCSLNVHGEKMWAEPCGFTREKGDSWRRSCSRGLGVVRPVFRGQSRPRQGHGI